MSEFRDHVTAQLAPFAGSRGYLDVRDTLLILRDALQSKITSARASGSSISYRAGLTEAMLFMDNLVNDIERDYLD